MPAAAAAQYTSSDISNSWRAILGTKGIVTTHNSIQFHRHGISTTAALDDIGKGLCVMPYKVEAPRTISGPDRKSRVVTPEGMVWRCPRKGCRKELALRSGTYFEGTNMLL